MRDSPGNSSKHLPRSWNSVAVLKHFGICADPDDHPSSLRSGGCSPLNTKTVDGMTHSPTQRARGILPRALKDESVILIKACPELRLTYELRLATFMAQQSRRRLLVITTVDCSASSALQAFAREHGIVIRSHKS